MKKVILISAILLSCSWSYAQREKVFYVEVAGAGALYSLNYDFRFNKKEDGPGLRTGFSILPQSNIMIPVQANYIFGTDKHRLELGLGISTFLNLENTNGDYQKFIPSVAIMYRLHPPEGVFVLRAGLSPLLFRPTNDELKGYALLALVWPGISVGFRF